MATKDLKFVYRDGVNSPTDPINGYQLIDNDSQWPGGIEGDLLYNFDTKTLRIFNGTYHAVIWPHPPAPAVVVPNINVLHYVGPTSYFITDANDVLSIHSPTAATAVYMHEVTTAKVKPYYIKAWAGYNVHIRTAHAGNYIEPGAVGEIIITPPSSVTLVPLTGHPYWAII